MVISARRMGILWGHLAFFTISRYFFLAKTDLSSKK
jgi:hypothetical protein